MVGEREDGRRQIAEMLKGQGWGLDWMDVVHGRGLEEPGKTQDAFHASSWLSTFMAYFVESKGHIGSEASISL